MKINSNSVILQPMDVHKQIKAMFLLIIISVMMLHNAVPHVHHLHEGHEVISGSTEHHHHGHEHSHHHPVENKSDEQDEDFLFSLLLKIHAHAFHTHQFTPLATDNSQLSKVKILSIAGVRETKRLVLCPVNQNLHRFSLFQELFCSNPFLFTHSLRGPPVLG